MPWCPICKNEYQDGYSKCADCGCDLVDELEEEIKFAALCLVTEEGTVTRLINYLTYTGIEAQYEYVDDQKAFRVMVPEEQLDKAKVAYTGFANVEKNTKAELLKEVEAILDLIPESSDGTEEMTDEEKERVLESVIAEQTYKPNQVYVKKADVYKDMTSTAVTFLVFANLLIVVFALGALNIISWFSSLPSLIVLAAMAIGCYIVGINACFRAKKAAKESREEDKQTDAVETWLKENIKKSVLDEKFGSVSSKEERYLKEIDYIKDELLQNFSGLDDSFVDSLVEEFYDSEIENSETEDSETATESEDTAEAVAESEEAVAEDSTETENDEQ